jgi:hypothetical protein
MKGNESSEEPRLSWKAHDKIVGLEGEIDKIVDEDLGDTKVNYALVLRGPLRDLHTVKQFIEDMTESEVIYQTKSLGKIMITRGDAE